MTHVGQINRACSGLAHRATETERQTDPKLLASGYVPVVHTKPVRRGVRGAPRGKDAQAGASAEFLIEEQ
jgi:hypothetical protein